MVRIISFISSNTRFVLYLGTALTTGGVGAVASSFNYQDQQSLYLFRELPDGSSSSSSSSSSRRRRSAPQSFDITSADKKEFNTFNQVKISYKDLISGTKSYNSGNYLLYYGSESCGHCMELLFSDSSLSRGSLNVNTSKLSEGALMNAYQFLREHNSLKGKNIKVIMFEDVPPTSEERINDDLWDLPWSKWSSTDLGKGHVVGEYKRYDKSALQMRSIMSYAAKVFGESKVLGTPTLIIYKDGIPKVFGSDKLEGLPDKEATSWSDPSSLKRYILYYFNKEEYNLTEEKGEEKKEK